MNKYSHLKKQFESPPVEYRSVPFWAWNDNLQIDELLHQMNEMKAQGIGGFFMHSRDGLETPYLGEEWMNAVRTVVEYAEEIGMKAWLYDEDRWPSGSAGGQIPALGDEYRAKGLTLEATGETAISSFDQVVAIYRTQVVEFQLAECERLPLNPVVDPLREGEVLLILRVEVSEPSEWFNDEAPPDSMNPATVRRFIEHTYEAYKNEVGKYFDRTVVGVFTDEPSVNDRHCRFTPGRGWIPWTYSFPELFREKRGYDVLDVIPYVFYDGSLSSKARHDYWRTVTDAFCEAYTRQLGEWCNENGIAFTGHYLWEGALGVATRVGGAIMPHYRYQHVPGIDLLCEQTDEYMTVKQCTSVANQYNKRFVISETYGCTGWEFTFEGQKWMGDWQYVLGVNLRSQHLALYSLKGCRKRDYPPVFNYQTSWWKYNHLVEDYFARIGAILSEGTAVRDILVLHPASTAWAMLGTSPTGFKRRGEDRDIPAVDRFGDEFNQLLKRVLVAHYDLDLGDETIMEEVGEVRDGKLYVKHVGYKLVIVPPIRTMLKSTLELLMRFVEAGGDVVVMTPAADMLEGVPSEELGRLYSHPKTSKVDSRDALISYLEQWSARNVSIRDASGNEASTLLYMLKKIEGGYSLFIVNNDRNQSYNVTIDTVAMGVVEEWDALRGETRTVNSILQDGRLRFSTRFGPADSKMFVIRDQDRSAINSKVGALKASESESNTKLDLYATSGPEFRFSRTMPNALTLDECSYRIHGNEWSSDMPVWEAQRDIRDQLGMRQVYYNGITQRYKWIHETHPGNGTTVSLRFRFEVSHVPSSQVYLVLEDAERYALRLNGAELPNTPDGWYVDRDFDRVKLNSLCRGVNELELTCSYTQGMEVEDIYLIGDFAVSPERSITKEPERLLTGDWCQQGYFHYNGSLVYQMDYSHRKEAGKRAVLYAGEFSAVTIEVRVNGQTAGHIPWKAADGVDLTPYLVEGDNTIELEVMGSPRNLFGPFHQAAGKTDTTSWSSFRTTGSDYTPDYIVQPYGLFQQVVIARENV
jgi:hypothetical protein